MGMQRGLCRRLVVPYVAHARSSRAAQVTTGRTLRIAYAAASWGHVDAEAHGFVAWRKALRNACKRLHARNASECQWVWISMSGNGAEAALQKYKDADFCLQPPGDTLPRPGVIDSISVGCIPVLFHPAQRTLWAHHWDGENSSVTIDFSGGAPRPRLHEQKVYEAQADAALRQLLQMPEAKLRQLKRGVAAAASRLVYGAGDTVEQANGADAIGILVERLRKLKLEPSQAEADEHARSLAARGAMIEAQRSYERRADIPRVQWFQRRRYK